jgi:two-component system cell cycle sensor histidine kinase/response regulator CckA
VAGGTVALLKRNVVATANRIEALAEASPLASFELDDDGRVLRWNEAAETLFGWPRDKVVGQRLPVRAEREERRLLLDFITGSAPRRDYELTCQRRDESTFRASVYSAPVGDARMPDGHVVLVADTSGRKHLESRLAQKSKMEALGRLAGGIAHDFNNLLLVIRSHAWLLGERGGRTPEIAAIENAAEDAGRIVAQLLAFGRRQEALEPEILDVNEVLAQVESLLGPVIGEDIDLVRSVSVASATVLADRTQLELIVVNLALNARDALPGGGKLEMAAEPAVHDGARWVRLRVSDTGVGIEPDVQARIFEPFFTTKEGGRGTGLGLSVVHELVAQNGGEIEVSSTPGRGTTFSVYFPYVGAPVSAPLREEPPAEPRATRGMETVLVADDEADVRDSLQRTLERYGYRVITAADADAALAIAEELRSEIDVVVTDVVMPSMSGFELARRLTSIAPDLPVVYISGYPDEAIVEAPLPGPVFLPKPFTPPLLARTIREALGSVRVPCG